MNEDGYRVKRVIVRPGKRLSLQRHRYRSEHWVITRGSGLLTLADSERPVQVGDVVAIPVDALHRIQNTGADDLVIIETQLGRCLEDDIIRVEDDWGRS